jgi:fibronectin-binding autotransporter adhesin
MNRSVQCVKVLFVLFVAAIVFGEFVSTAQAVLQAYEPFDYTAGAQVSGQNGGIGWADQTGGGTLVPWDAHNSGATGSYFAIKQTGVVSDVLAGGTSDPTPYTNTYTNGFIQTGGYAGPSAGRANGSTSTDHLSMWRTLAPSVTATFANGNTTWVSFSTARAFNANSRAPSLAIGAGILTTYSSGDRGDTIKSVNQIIGAYPNTAGAGGTYNGGNVLNGLQDFNSKEAIAIGADTTNAGQLSGSYVMNVDGVGATNVGWVGMYFAQKYDSTGARTRSGPVGGIGGTLSNGAPSGTLLTAPADHGYWMQGGGGGTLSLLHGYSTANTPYAGYGDNASHVNIVIAKIQWGAGADQGGGACSDLISYAVAHDNDVLTEANFDSWALTWDTGAVSNKQTYNQLSIAGGRYFADEVRIATTFYDGLGISFGKYWAPVSGGGGTGTWAWGSNVWAAAPGTQGTASQSITETLVFEGAADTITVNGTASVSMGLQFSVDGYSVVPGSSSPKISLDGKISADDNTITVSTGTTTISAELTGGSTFGMTKQGNGTLTLTAANTYTGATNVYGGTLQIASTGTIENTSDISVGGGAKFLYNNSAIPLSQPITLTSGATLGGTGTLAVATTIVSGAMLAPGASVGTLTVDNKSMTWENGGVYVWEISDATGAAGTGWDLLKLLNPDGKLDLMSLTGGFTIDVNGLTSGGVPGMPANFESGKEYDWTIASADGGIDGFEAGKFTFTETGFDFQTSAMKFEMAQVGNDLVLKLKSTGTTSTIRTWLEAAATSEWGAVSGNWDLGVPGLTNEVVFDAKGANMPNLAAPGSAKSIEFKTGDWTISQTDSQTLTVETGNITSAGDPGTTNTIAPQVLIGDSATAATFDVKGNATHNLVLTAPLAIGTRTLDKNGIGTLTTAAITAGTVNVNAGRLTVNSSIKDASLIYISADSTLATSATVRSTNVTAALTIEGGDMPTGTLDLNDGLLAINYTGDSPIDTVRAQIVSAYNAAGGGDWGGPGITSAWLAGGSTTNSIGYAYNGESAVWFDSGIPFGDTTAVAANSVLVRYTLIGDVNLDGIVDDSDISILSNNYGFTDISWADGDVYGYDGIVSDDDVGLQANNYGMTAGQLTGGISAVPEPATLALVALGGALLRRRRGNRVGA